VEQGGVMSVILILILASLAMALVFLAAFVWSVRSGQYEDTTTPSMRILLDEPVTKATVRTADETTAPQPVARQP
jgi:cbb3-type cytochrome oxidase maturation protein